MPPAFAESPRSIAAQARARRALARAGSLRRLAGRAAPAPTATDLNVENIQAAAAELGVEARLLRNGFLELSHGGAVSYARSADFDFERLVTWLVCGDKWMTATLLSARDLPVPRFGAFRVGDYADARRFFEELSKPVVTKPARDTAGGVGITLDVTTPAEFRAGFVKASAHGGEVLVEEQVDGENLRVTILDGRILGAVRRLPAHVTGDGRRTVAALVEAKNELWRSRAAENRLLRPIELDREARRVLAGQGLTPGSVPESGRCVRLREVSNADQGGEIEDLGPGLHEEQRALAVAAAEAIGVRLAGVDLITSDPGAPLASARVVINEVNTTPSLYVANALRDGVPSTYAARCVLSRLFNLAEATA